MARNRLYLLLTLVITAGYVWVIWSYSYSTCNSDFTPCIFKNTTGIACPSCGTTRAMLLLSQGQLTESLRLNPLGTIMGSLMVILPVWLLYDVVTKKDTLYKSYRNFENTIRLRRVAIVLILLILTNWIWNIQKGL